MNRKLILVGGYCATGKSTFARKLSARLGWPCLDKDTLKEVVADSLEPIPHEYSAPLSGTATRLLMHAAARSFAAGQPLILESNFRPHEIEELGALAREHAYAVMTFVFTADLRVVYERYRAREGTPERHWVHKSVRGESFEDFVRGHTPFGEIALGQVVRADMTSFEHADYPALFAAAEDFAGQEG